MLLGVVVIKSLIHYCLKTITLDWIVATQCVAWTFIWNTSGLVSKTSICGG